MYTTWKNQTKNIKGVTDPSKKTNVPGKTQAADGENVQMQYVVDEKGTPVDGFRAAEMRKVARSIWAEIASAGLAPDKWMTDAGLGVADHYNHEMQARFPELRLCDNGWKPEQIAKDYYPSWRTARMKKGTLHPVKNEEANDAPSIPQKRKSPSETDTENNPPPGQDIQPKKKASVDKAIESDSLTMPEVSLSSFLIRY
jgi:hypothetical protein